MTSPVDGPRYWNYQVHIWLKYYVYMRLVTPGKKPGTYETMLTFVISGLWHGFYACYHVFFISAAVLQELSKDIYKSQRLFSFIPLKLRKVLCWFMTYLFFDYLGVCVNALSLANVFVFSQAMHHYIFVVIIVGFIVMRFFVMPYARKLDKKH